MAGVTHIKVLPSHVEYLTVTLENGNVLHYSDFKKYSDYDYLSTELIGSAVSDVVSATTSMNYPPARLTLDTSGAEPIWIIDFRPLHLYAIGNTEDPTNCVYIDDLTNPSGVFNSKGWTSNNAFDWTWGVYSNFHTITYNSSTGKYDIECTEYVG